MSSFLGQNIEVQLTSGGAVRGKITSIDASSGSLSIQRPDQTSVVVTRAEIADLKMLPAEAASSGPLPNTFQDPAIISYKQDTNKAMEKLSLQPTASSPLPMPRAPAAMLAATSDTGSTGKPRKATKVKAKKNGAIDYNVGTSSRTQTEDETDYNLSERKNHLKNKKKNQQQQQQRALNGGQSDLEEDFDFDKALKSFDKRRIWQEIKTTDQTDPKMLLVSHNRLKGSDAGTDKGRYNGRSAQDKLGLHEPVLSPSPTASHSSLSPVVGEEKVTVKMETRENTSLLQGGRDMVDVELQRVRGNALQREMENSKLKNEIRSLKEKARVLEALGGVELELQSEEVDGHKWKGVIFESLTAHAESRRSATKPAPGSVTFLLKTFQGETSKLRYLGVLQEQSDAVVLDRLPPQYTKEMGLKTESASVFVRRIKDAVQSK